MTEKKKLVSPRLPPAGLSGRFLNPGEDVKGWDLYNTTGDFIGSRIWKMAGKDGGQAVWPKWWYRADVGFEIDRLGYFIKPKMGKPPIIPKIDMETPIKPINLNGYFLEIGTKVEELDLFYATSLDKWKQCEALGYPTQLSNFIFRPTQGYVYDKEKFFVRPLKENCSVLSSYQVIIYDNEPDKKYHINYAPKEEEKFEGIKKDSYNS